MKANELRIGNLINVSCPESKYLPFKQVSIEPFNTHHLTDILKENTKWVYEPILLTEEWLIKAGYSLKIDTSPYNYRICLSKMIFYIRYGKFTTDGGKTYITGFNALFIGNRFIRVIRYVHELQNLHYDLIGKELNFKL